jgi:hypothetical protein
LFQKFLEDNEGKENFVNYKTNFVYTILQPFKHESDDLKSMLLNDLSPDEKLIRGAVRIWQDPHSLNRCIHQQSIEANILIELHSTNSNYDHACAHFGFTDSNGNTNMKYLSLVNSITELNDSIIFISIQLLLQNPKFLVGYDAEVV